jgi:hypothetical protein
MIEYNAPFGAHARRAIEVQPDVVSGTASMQKINTGKSSDDVNDSYRPAEAIERTAGLADVAASAGCPSSTVRL